MPKRPTILDVARLAGVSKSTVSLVLQNSKQVKPSTREAVEEAMTSLNYVYNRSAANLRGSATGLVGLVINDLRNPFFTEFAASAQMAFNKEGYSTVIANTDESPEMQAQVIESMIEHGVAAFLISPAYGGGDDSFDRIERAAIPAMQVLRRADERTGLFPFASPDYETGSELAMRHMIDVGCNEIAFVGGFADREVTLQRKSGYETVISQQGRKSHVYPGRPTRSFGREMALTLHRDHPEIEAAICFNDLVALGMLAGFAELGRKVGEDFRLIGFDDIEECSLVYPKLSSVHCGISRFGADAAQAMLRWITDGVQPENDLRTPVELAARASSLGFDR
ncbi:LacI family DNA-binding transcriptional regulator [Nioella aestuarii]|uniref:LacI family DNA-binding transcriptional regulator n=1 Tax=Nioella aestuarii TaxID=1662864 RepID=UPI003D7F6B95